MNAQILPFAAAVPPALVARYQIHRYPATLIDVRTLHDGARLTLRPVLPQDAELIAELIARLSPAGRRNRFHGAVQISADQVQRMSCVDYDRELAVVVTAREAGVERVIADARYCVDEGAGPDGARGAEFALMVDERWQRRGLGGWAMAALRDAARAAGLHWLHGEVLSSNLPMLGLMRCCGLCCTPDLADDRLVQVQERLGVGGRPTLRCASRSALRQMQNWIAR